MKTYMTTLKGSGRLRPLTIVCSECGKKSHGSKFNIFVEQGYVLYSMWKPARYVCNDCVFLFGRCDICESWHKIEELEDIRTGCGSASCCISCMPEQIEYMRQDLARAEKWLQDQHQKLKEA